MSAPNNPALDVTPREGPLIDDWRPEDPHFWGAIGKPIATRNLWISIPALFLAFAVWMVWSVVILDLNEAGFSFSTDQLFWLAALPSLSGATFRAFYSFMVPIFGGRRWTALSTAALLIPTVWMGFALRDPSTSYGVFVTIALLCGFGGGSFASSMSNISFFYPKSQQGTALGLNAGLGNLGVSAMQFIVPLVMSVGLFGALGGESQPLADGSKVWLQNAGLVWVPLIVVVSLVAWFGMNDLTSAQASFSEQSVIFKRQHTWVMCWLYLGAFGSFIGFAAAFPLLINTEFPEVNSLQFAFLGPLVGALTRPLGGWIGDKLGGARVTLWCFVVMIGAVIATITFLPHEGQGGNFYGFLIVMLVLFATSGIASGSTFRMIPVIFRTLHERWSACRGDATRDHALRQAGKESAAVIGFNSAVGAFGGFFIPKSFGTSIQLTGGAEVALCGFIAFYLSCLLTTWWCYSRKGAAIPC